MTTSISARRNPRSFIADESLIVEEKIDGTNVGIHFTSGGQMVLQCRGHLITEGMHPQYDLFKQWTVVKRPVLEERLEDRYILFGEWMYARHSVHYRQLPHYFFEFDVYDKQSEALPEPGTADGPAGRTRTSKPCRSSIPGPSARDELADLIGPSRFDARFENPVTKRVDNLMEGLYLRTEADGTVTGRAKFVRTEFVEKVKQSTHWQHQAVVPNLLKEGADLWS